MTNNVRAGRPGGRGPGVRPSIAAGLAAAAALGLAGCNATLPKVLLEPAVLESSPRVEKLLFAEVAEGGNVFDLREEPEGGFTALTGAGAYRFDRHGQLVEKVRFVRDDLFRTRFLAVETAFGRYLGWGRGTLSFFSADGQLRASLPSTWSFTVGDVGADGSFDFVRTVERKEDCRFPRYCTWISVYEVEGRGTTTRAATPFILKDVEIVPAGTPQAGHLVLMMYPDGERGSTFEVWDGELRRLSGWQTVPVGDFVLARREGELRVVTIEGDHLVFRDLAGSESGRLELPHAGRLRTPLWADLAGGWGVAVVSGLQAPRFVVAIYDQVGRRVYQEVGAPHADALLVPEEATDRFYLAHGSRIFEYRLQPGTGGPAAD